MGGVPLTTGGGSHISQGQEAGKSHHSWNIRGLFTPLNLCICHSVCLHAPHCAPPTAPKQNPSFSTFKAEFSANYFLWSSPMPIRMYGCLHWYLLHLALASFKVLSRQREHTCAHKPTHTHTHTHTHTIVRMSLSSQLCHESFQDSFSFHLCNPRACHPVQAQ